MTPAYIKTIRELCGWIEITIAQAEADLPDEIRKEHFIAAKHGPNAWNAVYHFHFSDLLTDPEQLLALLALKQLVECKAALTGILQEFALLNTPPDLHLGKMRNH